MKWRKGSKDYCNIVGGVEVLLVVIAIIVLILSSSYFGNEFNKLLVKP